MSGDLYAKAIQTLEDVSMLSMARLYNKVAEQLIEYGLNVVSRIAHTQSLWINTLSERTDNCRKRRRLDDASQS
ncbi:hypothetical protein HBI56_237330 [Parastagonospora nodorum]|nr:hypothetical protein HBI10_178380 [Parastagonospora nodorum]KAH4010096.1 hypothetical protein HBI09_232730 [Parastagonospora nodorum]KAH4017688.1 hypothetical protein HBI13_143980 [Parastagonospora nodorum]KAH4160907.1 hypothetical protein HBH43_172340 [Parastagonospora nodorum]KAH4185108.1 hypothetical protein HBH42_184750 [Parastagonospora nodorum]